jgi:acetoin:2,6-dichlorophenolindophenol oxidoreductase subunit beta
VRIVLAALPTSFRDALAEEMRRDERVVLFGEDIAAAGGVFKATPGLAEEFGDERVFDTPISELALAGAAFGSAVTGLRPVIEIMFGDFMALAMDSLVNQAAKYWYMSNEQAPVPLVVRCAVGAGGRFGAIHSQTPATWLQSVAGLKIVAPAFPDDARGLIAAAVRDPNPVVVLEHKRLYPVKGEIGAEPVEIGSARVVRSGADITIVSVMRGVHDALAAADTLAAAGVDAEVIDLRSLRPLDHATVVGSVRKTSRLLAVEEGPELGGWASGLVGAVAARALGDLDDVWTLTTPDTPIPYSPVLEDAFLPDADAIARSVLERLAVAGPA